MSNVVAIDLGGTNTRAARVDAEGRIAGRKKVATPTARGMAAVVNEIAALIRDVRDAQTVGVGVATPGVPDPETGIMALPACNIADSAGFPLTSTLEASAKLPIAADNDGNLAALAEVWRGAGQGERVVMIFTLGTGIGGGLILDGQVYHGFRNKGTEFGHVSIQYDGRKCPCGGTGCVEQYASAIALGRDAREALQSAPEARQSALWKMCGGAEGLARVDSRMVCDAARAGDPFACFLLDRCCNWLATGMGSLINAFNPSCVILGGGMALAGETLLARVQKAIPNGHVYMPIWQDLKLRVATLGDDAGLLGAARLAFQKVGR